MILEAEYVSSFNENLAQKRAVQKAEAEAKARA